jgi:3-oxoacyl-[acyl-carrier protein] reductase
MFTSVSGYSVVVTGGTKGIGKGIARVFAKAGANVLITGRDEASAKSACAELTGLGGGTVTYLIAEVSSKSDCDRVAATAIERNGGIDVLCANAGIFPDSKLATMS